MIRQDGRIVAEHPRSIGRGETTYDPWHYVPVLARKPPARCATALSSADVVLNILAPYREPAPPANIRTHAAHRASAARF